MCLRKINHTPPITPNPPKTQHTTHPNTTDSAPLDEHERLQRERAKKGVKLLRWIVGGLASYLAYRLLRRAARRWLGLGRGLGLLTAAAAAGTTGQGHMSSSHLAYGAYPPSSSGAGGNGISDAAMEQAFRMSSSSSSGAGRGGYGAASSYPYGSAAAGPYGRRI